jgi:prolipoprotein diacylglyceryl transferase
MDGFIKALKIWEGGLGIWGAVAGGALGAWLGCRQIGIRFTFVADCIAVGLPLAQAVGRLGNWFNNELYGGKTTLPWGLEVHRMSTGQVGEPPVGQAILGPNGQPELLDGLYHPTFLYELIWDLGVAGLVLWADRKYKFGKGRAFALYVMAYTAGRLWIEMMRTDPAEIVGGLRLNVWTSIIVFLGALAYFLLRKGPQEFLVPAPDGQKGYQVVTEAEFKEYQASGQAPSAPDTSSGPPASPPADQPSDSIESEEHQHVKD